MLRLFLALSFLLVLLLSCAKCHEYIIVDDAMGGMCSVECHSCFVLGVVQGLLVAVDEEQWEEAKHTAQCHTNGAASMYGHTSHQKARLRGKGDGGDTRVRTTQTQCVGPRQQQWCESMRASDLSSGHVRHFKAQPGSKGLNDATQTNTSNVRDKVAQASSTHCGDGENLCQCTVKTQRRWMW